MMLSVIVSASNLLQRELSRPVHVHHHLISTAAIGMRSIRAFAVALHGIGGVVVSHD
jgi:hypothetical protein